MTQSQVTAICQDSIGYLWVGTLGGISKYNGNKFTNFSTDNGLLNNRVNTIKWIKSKLYVAHQGGISIIDKNNIYTYTLEGENTNNSITSIIEYNKQIIIATNGRGLYKFENNKFIPIPILQKEYKYVRDLFVWNDFLYIGTRDGAVRTNNLKSIDYFISNNSSISSFSIYKNQLAISSFYDGILFYDSKRITKRLLQTDDFVINQINTDSQNNLWVSTSNGLFLYNTDGLQQFNNITGLPINVISTVFEDLDKNIWLGTQGKGLVKAGIGAISYFDKSTRLPSDIVLCGTQDKNGTYFFGTLDNGIFKTKDFKNYTHYKTTSSVWCAISDIDGYSWFGTKDGLYAIDKNNAVKIHHFNDNAPGFKITSFYKIDSKSMYIGGSHGIVKYQQGEFTTIGKNNQEIGTIRAITTRNNQLLVGTDIGLYQLNANNLFELIGETNHPSYSLIKTPSNRIFFGSEDGLFELLNNNTVSRIKFSNDVASNYVNFLSENNNNIIVGTNNGVYIINTENKVKIIQRIGEADGLTDPETNLNSSLIDNQGNLWFGTASALIKFDLKHYKLFLGNVKLQLENILLDYAPFQYEKYGATNKNGIPQNMVFPYSKNNFQFNFNAVALANYENIVFQFKVEGLNENWMPASKTTHLTLNQLPAGDYKIYAQALLDDGTILDTLNINFTIQQAFYKTWWFILLLLLIVTTIVIFGIRQKIKIEHDKHKFEQAELNARLVLLEQESLNASMNRHFIFNSLNSIQYFINISDKISANKYLSNFAKLIRKNLDTSSEHNSLVGLDDEIERIELYLSLESMRFKDKFTYHINTNNVDLESTKIPAMMIQPFVENSIIHGILPQQDKVGKIEINIENKDSMLLISIIDNGIGIDKSIQNKQKGLGDHISKGMEITNKRIKIIKQISGKNMEIIGPRQVTDSSNNSCGTEVIIKISVK
ncbi:MAG: histidine kinase [Crocinitomicaceae bacterium]|nr:histidine kinase [Crocinitomicaceae bacterium]